MHNKPDFVDTCEVQQVCPPLIAAEINTVTHSTSLCLTTKESFENVRSHIVLNSPITHTMPTGNIPEAPELGTPCYKIVGPNDVSFRGFSLCV